MVEARKKYTARKIVAELERHIRERGLAGGVRLSTAPLMAERFGVSVKTVHRAVGHLVDKGLVYRVRGSGTYVSDRGAGVAGLRVGLFLWQQQSGSPVLDQVAFGDYTDVLMEKIGERGHHVELILERISNKSGCVLNRMELEKFDVIIAAAGFLEVAEARLRAFRGELILINDDISHPGPWHQVVYDYRPGFCRALEYLRSLGVKRIFVPGATGVEVCVRRFRALQEEALRLGFRAEDIEFREGDCGALSMMVMAGRDCGKYYLEHCESGTAIVSVSDYLAVGMQDVFLERGLQPGRDVKLVSYDNLEARLGEGVPALGFTGISHPMEEHAAAAANMLDNLQRRDGTDRAFRIYVTPAHEFVRRNSA